MFGDKSFAKKIAERLREEDAQGPKLAHQPIPDDMKKLLGRMP